MKNEIFIVPLFVWYDTFYRQESKDIFDKVCSIDEKEEAYVSRMVPFKKRCGVKNKNVINLDNKCHCSESNNKGVGKYDK